MDFESFTSRHDADFVRIARHSRGEWTADDVCNEAYILAIDIGARRGQALDLGNPEDASVLIRWLYNHCVKYGEQVVRRAQRLDHAASGDDDRGHHWLLDTLVADDGADALSLLEAAEHAVAERDMPDPYHSPAAGFAWLLRHFDQRMADVAAFLLISLSWCYRCRHRAHQLADRQWPLPDLAIGADADAIRPWRRFRLPAEALPDAGQMELDFLGTPVQPTRGQLWLL